MIILSVGVGWYINELKGNNSIVKNINIVEEDTIRKSIEKIYDAVVVIEAYNMDGQSSTGSGFVYKVDNDYGYIITNYHVVKNSDSIMIINNNNEEFSSKLLGYDELSDLAVLKIERDNVLLVASLSNNNINVGDTVFTVGSPSGAQYIGTVTKGIVSAVDREIFVDIGSEEYIMNVIQTDAAINPGNSGGPLVNINGDVIGINSLKLVEDEVEGMGFAIPIQEALLYIDRLEHGKEIKRPYLGLELINNNPGVKIKNIKIDSIKSDLKLNDIIISIDDVIVKDTVHFRYLLYKYEVGDKIKINYLRDNEEYYTYINLDE